MTTPVYPAAIKTWTDKVDFVDDVSSQHINEAYAEIIAIEEDLSGSTSAATANKYMKRDANGRAKVAAPNTSDDVARKAEVDAVQDDLDTHKSENAVHVPDLGTTTNIGNAYNITSSKVINDRNKFSVKFNAVASGTATLNISSDGTARTLKKPDGTDFKPKAGIYSFIRDGVNFQLLGEGGEYGNATISDVRNGVTFGTDSGLQTGTLIPINPSVGDIIMYEDTTDYRIVGAGTKIASKKYTINYSGSIRIKFTLREEYTSSPASARVYKNGVGFGTIRSTSSTTNVIFTEDFTCNAGDYFQIYIFSNNLAEHVDNCKICSNVSDLLVIT